MPVSLSLSHIPLHSLSLTLPLTPLFSTLCHSPSHSFVTSSPPSHARVSPPSHSRASPHRHPLMLMPLSLSRLSHSPFPLSVSLHSQAPSPSVSQFSQVWFSYCVIFSCGFVVLFQSYDWFDCFVCYSVWFPRKCKKNLFGILCWDWCLFILNFK